MSAIFYKLPDGTSINLNRVTSFYLTADNGIIFNYGDGQHEKYNISRDANSVIDKINKTIVQLIPCPSSVPLFNIYDIRDERYYPEPVSGLALCVDGIVRSLSVCEDKEKIRLATDSSNFVGCIHQDVLEELRKEDMVEYDLQNEDE